MSSCISVYFVLNSITCQVTDKSKSTAAIQKRNFVLHILQFYAYLKFFRIYRAYLTKFWKNVFQITNTNKKK